MDLRDVPDTMKMPPKVEVAELPADLEIAGHAFREAIVRLGLSVEGLLWVNMAETKRFEMWIVWSGIDAYGPLSIAKLLFRAYNAAVLPHAINPFDVNVVGPEHLVARLHAAFSGGSDLKLPEDTEYGMLYLKEDESETALFAVKRTWVLLPIKRRLPKKEIDRGWRRFQANIEKLAA